MESNQEVTVFQSPPIGEHLGRCGKPFASRAMKLVSRTSGTTEASNTVLSQLSYGLFHPVGFEPTTTRLQVEVTHFYATMHWGKVWGKNFRFAPQAFPTRDATVRNQTLLRYTVPVKQPSLSQCHDAICCTVACRRAYFRLMLSTSSFSSLLLSGEQSADPDFSPIEERVRKRHRMKSVYYIYLCFETPSLRLQIRTSRASQGLCPPASCRVPASLPRSASRRGM